MSRISIARRAAALLFLFIVLPGAAVAAAGCAGDCNDDGEVKVNELITGVNIVLGSETLDRCASLDGTGDGQIAINELIAAVGASLDGCPEPVDRLDSVGAVTLGVARGLSGLAAVFQNLISTVNAVNGSNDPDPTVNECPIAGGYTLECLGVGPFRVRNTFVWDGCRYAAPGGTLTLAGTIVGNSAGACPSLILPPVTLEIDFSLTFEDGTTGATRTVAIDATGTISTVAFEERPCPLKGGEADVHRHHPHHVEHRRRGALRVRWDAAGAAPERVLRRQLPTGLGARHGRRRHPAHRRARRTAADVRRHAHRHAG